MQLINWKQDWWNLVRRTVLIWTGTIFRDVFVKLLPVLLLTQVMFYKATIRSIENRIRKIRLNTNLFLTPMFDSFVPFFIRALNGKLFPFLSVFLFACTEHMLVVMCPWHDYQINSFILVQLIGFPLQTFFVAIWWFGRKLMLSVKIGQALCRSAQIIS